MTRKRVGGVALTVAFGLFCAALTLTVERDDALVALWSAVAVGLVAGLLSFDPVWARVREIATAPRQVAEASASAARPEAVALTELERQVAELGEVVRELGDKLEAGAAR